MNTKWVEDELKVIKEKGLYRQLKTIETPPEPRIKIRGKELLLLSSNNYLGLASDDRLIQSATEVLQSFGVGSGGARLTTGNTIWHDQLEKRVATFKKAESALLFSSGYLANVGVLSSVAGEGDVILSDELNHASIVDGCRLSKAKTIIYHHKSMNDLEEKLRMTSVFKKKFIVTDGVFSMDGDLAPLPEIVALARKYNAYVIMDDAHGTGVLGEHGRGTAEHFNLEHEIDLVIGTFSKAVGTEGAYVAGKEVWIQYLRNKARSFIFQTAMAPSIAAATITSIDIIEQNQQLRQHLLRLGKMLRKQLKLLGFRVDDGITPIIPVIIGEAKLAVEFAKELEEQGIFAPAIRPPTVPIGQCRIRISLMASHTEEQIGEVIEVFQRVGQSLGVIQ
ncbi:8-amino-7-oxononanoate synthase [Tepidibacillus fermentans]|uniref:8-amino-7-ketopelargonate synthase n=1 Tax=Tepidibacillus fermentans TaxID=1281767 RepID=A0A4R3KA81_9BACI|nr:8-amino-7-oxononanoate synthase [Tepidibacillus fermentans]TCS79551.1 8-amino-7-oxononanoate synthase [Tepidibacillus fermentans]